MKTPGSPPPATDQLVGSFRTFGAYGPVYQVIGPVTGQKVPVVVVQSGEELAYPMAQALQDPETE